MQGLGALPSARLTIVSEMCIKPLQFTLGKESCKMHRCHMHRIARFLPLAAALLCAPALADKAFSPEDAAYIDWSWKNCETKSTDKEHQLADAATTGGGEKFHEQYKKALQKLTDVTRTPTETERLCTTILGMYGPSASVIPDLIVAKGEAPPPPTPTATTTPAAAPSSTHGHRHH